MQFKIPIPSNTLKKNQNVSVICSIKIHGAFIHFRMRFKLDDQSNNFIWLIIHANGEILHQQHIVWLLR